MASVIFLFILLKLYKRYKRYRKYIKGSVNISAHLSIKIILVDPNLVRIFSGNDFFDPNYGAHF